MGFTLTASPSSEVVLAEKTAWGVQLTVTSDDADKYPPKCLVFQAESPGELNTRSWFTAVASPAQLLEYPEDEPQAPESDGDLLPYFRLDTVQLIGRNPVDLQNLTAQFAEELLLLQRNLDALDVFGGGQVIDLTSGDLTNIGVPPLNPSPTVPDFSELFEENLS